MHIKKIVIGGVPPFGNLPIYDANYIMGVSDGYFQVECDKRVNLFTGGNGTGKTTIVRALHHFYSQGPDKPFSGPDHHYGWLEASEDWPSTPRPNARTRGTKPVFYGGPNWKEVPILYIPATRVNLQVGPLIGNNPVPEDAVSRWDPPWSTTMGSDGRFFFTGPFAPLFDYGTGVFSGQHVERAADELRDRFVLESRREKLDQLESAISLGLICVKDICAEVIGNPTAHPYTLTMDVVVADPNGGDPYEGNPNDDEFIERRTLFHQGMGIETNDNPMGEPLYAGHLSSGTQSTLLWVRALALEIANHYDWEERWQERPAVLLIDEIENHLHPSWQRGVIPALLEHFPALQIFATTHSPYVVAGLRAGQVHNLSRDLESDARRFVMGENQINVETNEEDIVGLTADEISRKYLNVVDPTDKPTARASEELRRLQNEGTRTDALQEEERQQRIDELRALVDRNLLDGGSSAAQRKLFEEQVAQALENYRRFPNLN